MDQNLFEPFISSTKKVIEEVCGISMRVGVQKNEVSEFVSFGVASIITFGGEIKGRFIIDIEKNFACKLVGNMLGESITAEDENLLPGIQEINNIIAGDANTFINDTFNMELRLAPPMVFMGEDFWITSFEIYGREVMFESEHGLLRVNISLSGGEEGE